MRDPEGQNSAYTVREERLVSAWQRTHPRDLSTAPRSHNYLGTVEMTNADGIAIQSCPVSKELLKKRIVKPDEQSTIH
jgi:hypothetical protein